VEIINKKRTPAEARVQFNREASRLGDASAAIRTGQHGTEIRRVYMLAIFNKFVKHMYASTTFGTPWLIMTTSYTETGALVPGHSADVRYCTTRASQ